MGELDHKPSPSHKDTDDYTAKRQSRVAHFNRLSTAPASFQRHRRVSSSSKEGKHLKDENRSEEVAQQDPFSAESPSQTPLLGPTRTGSQVSLSSMVRSAALDSPDAGFNLSGPSTLPFPSSQPSRNVTPSAGAGAGAAAAPGSTSTHSNNNNNNNNNNNCNTTAAPAASARIPVAPAAPAAIDRMASMDASLGAASYIPQNKQQSSKRLRATTLDVPGLTRSKVSPDGRIARDDVGAKLVIVMVGLPARGKSYITKKLARFLNWQQHDCRIFNVGNTRRRASKHAGPAMQPLPDEPTKVQQEQEEKAQEKAKEHHEEQETEHAGDFFSPDNPRTVAQREKWAEDTLQELLDYVLDGEGSVGILDATNTTRLRRKRVMKIINERSQGQLKVLFLESICTQRHIIESNVRLKLSGPDYKHMDQKKAIDDFLLRLQNYERAYEPICAEEEADPLFQYIKFINVGQKFECGNIKGFLAGQTVFFLLNFNLQPRQIWITRHGESTDNQLGKIGGDADLTERGRRYAAALSKFIKYKKQEFQKRLIKESAEQLQILRESGSRPPTPDNEPSDQNFCVWTSMLRRTIETATFFEDSEFDVKEMRMLNELDPGICNGMTYQEIKDKYPHEYAARMQDKIRYRYPGIGGESYLDVINRLRPVIVEIERMEENCLVICHRVVARVLLSYFMNLGRDAIGDLEVPLHTLYVLEPKPYGVDWALYKYNERVNWFYEVSPEAARVQSQLNDHKRRYTVVATAGMKLGDDSWIPPKREVEYDNSAIEASSDEEGDEDQNDENPPEIPNRPTFDQNTNNYNNEKNTSDQNGLNANDDPRLETAVSEKLQIQ